MKIKLSLLTLLFAFLFILSGCNDKENNSIEETEPEIPKNGVYYEYSDGGNSDRVVSATTYKNGKAVSVNEYDYWSDGRLKTITTKVDSKETQSWNYNYTEDGLLSQMVRTYTEDGYSMRDDYRYNKNGKIDSLAWYEDDVYEGGLRYTYNANDDTTLEEQLDANGDVIVYTEYNFDSEGNTVSAHKYMYGSVVSYSLYTYENDKLSLITYYSSSDAITSMTKYEYDSMGRISKVHVCDSEGTTLGYTESLYDEDGFNYKDICYENGVPVYGYDYTKDGAPVYHEY